jgi:hypothetical protein
MKPTISPVDAVINPSLQQLEKKQEELTFLLKSFEEKRDKLNMIISEKRGAIGVLRVLTSTASNTSNSFNTNNLIGGMGSIGGNPNQNQNLGGNQNLNQNMYNFPLTSSSSSSSSFSTGGGQSVSFSEMPSQSSPNQMGQMGQGQMGQGQGSATGQSVLTSGNSKSIYKAFSDPSFQTPSR